MMFETFLSLIGWKKTRDKLKKPISQYFLAFLLILLKEICNISFLTFFFSITASYLDLVVKRNMPDNELEEKIVKVCKKMKFKYYQTTLGKSSFWHFNFFCLSIGLSQFPSFLHLSPFFSSHQWQICAQNKFRSCIR